MIRIYYEEYYNDYKKEYYEKEFRNLTDLEDWIFWQMKRPYDHKDKTNRYAMFFPHLTEPSRIEFTPTWGGPSYWIDMIENDFGIMFSDGKYTNGYTHWNDEVKEWLAHCDKRRDTPEFKFV